MGISQIPQALVPTSLVTPFTTWTAFTPTWNNLTVGNASQEARYTQVGKTVFFWVKLELGSTSSVGTEPRMNFPIEARSTAAGQCAQLNYNFLDNGVAQYFAIGAGLVNTQTTFRLHIFNANSTYVNSTQITSTVPFSWGSSDIIHISGSYEVA
jgi:hypothetical protein